MSNTSNSYEWRLTLRVISGCMVLIGCVVSVIFSLRYSREKTVQSWISVPIDSLTLEVTEPRALSRKPRFRLKASYSYRVAGTAYHGSRIGYLQNDWFRYRSEAEAVAKSVREAGVVYVNPHVYEEAILIRVTSLDDALRSGLWRVAGIALGAAGLFAAGEVWWWTRPNRERTIKKAAEPVATDNPDDAQRLREDH